jgi:predicted transcriptional regulator of viral defense system
MTYLWYFTQMKSGNINYLSEYLDELQSQGKYTFLQSEAIAQLNISTVAYQKAVYRLTKKNRLVRIKPNFYVIVPVEYRSLGCLPASWFVDDLMQHLNASYYVGLLTAAAMYGAGHQQPNVFQIVTDKIIRPITKGALKIDFIYAKSLIKMPVTKMKTATGYMNVSTPEATAYDLVKYLSAAAQINNVATVLTELSEKLDATKLLEIARSDAIAISVIQRLGYLLDYLNSGINTDELAKLANGKNYYKYIPLVAAQKGEMHKKIIYARNARWKIIINEKIEPDL